MIQDDVNGLETTLKALINSYKTVDKASREYTHLSHAIEREYGMYHSYVRHIPSIIAKDYEYIKGFMLETFYVEKTK